MAQQSHPYDLEAVGRLFRLPGKYREGGPVGSGHINDSFAVLYEKSGRHVRYIHQRINDRIFRDVPMLMHNIHRVTDHIRSRVRQEGRHDPRRSLTLCPAKNGELYARDEEGCYWRTYEYIEGAHTHDVIEDDRHAFEAARAFGRFQSLLSDLPEPRLHETIADFHNTPKRFARLEEAVKGDVCGRAKDCRRETDLAMEWRGEAGRLLDLSAHGDIPERVTHNDTKLNNVMLDERTGEGICVIDLDTVMPGLSLYDFGDMVRTATNSGAEDERNPDHVNCRLPVFEALTRGYLEAARSFLTPAEVDHLAFAGRLLTLECGIRFLTDHLQGDTYFKIHREGHNLDRCRAQFKLVSEMIRVEPQMRSIVRRAVNDGM
jgi:Ser/Thr protein kinase RdoA (MazF antagonist)